MGEVAGPTVVRDSWLVESPDPKWPERAIPSTRSAARLQQVALVLAVSAPLWWLPGGFSRFVLAKLLLTALAALVAALARPLGALPRPVLLAGAAWAGVFTLTALLGDTPLASLAGRWPRFEGLPTLGLYAAACWTGARVVGHDAVAVRRLHAAVGTLAVVLAAFSALDVLGVTPLGPSTDERSGSVLGNATDQGAVAMMAALLLVGPTLRPAGGRDDGEGRWRRPLLVAALAAAVATVAMSGSRTALGLTLAGLVVAAFVLRRPSGTDGPVAPVRRTALQGAAAVALLVGVALLVPTTRERLLGLGTAEGRLHQWRLTLDLVGDHLLLGLGGSRYVDAFLAYEDATFVDFTGPQRLADSPHSVLLQVLVAGGLVLLAATLVGGYVVARQALRAWADHPAGRTATLAVLAYLALACVNFTTAGPTCLAVLLLGTVIAVPARTDAPARAPLVAGVSGLLALAVAAAAVGEVQLQRGVDAADRRAVAAAETHVEQARRWRPWDVDVPIIAARVLAEEAAAGDATAAPVGERLARAGLDGAPDSYETLVALGVTLSAQGRVGDAAETLDRAVALAPERPDGYVQRAIARVGLGQVDEAVVDLLRAREIMPRSAVVRRLLRRVSASASP